MLLLVSLLRDSERVPTLWAVDAPDRDAVGSSSRFSRSDSARAVSVSPSSARTISRVQVDAFLRDDSWPPGENGVAAHGLGRKHTRSLFRTRTFDITFLAALDQTTLLRTMTATVKLDLQHMNVVFSPSYGCLRSRRCVFLT